MKILVFLALAIALASANDQCTWGESYWCISLENAKECGAFQHCLSTVWKNQKLEVDGSDVCTFCENIISDVKSLITNKQTLSEIKQFMQSACSIIPIADVAGKCKQMVDKYLQEFVAMVEKDIDPQMICSLFGMCRALKDTVQHHPVNTLHRVPLTKIENWKQDPICPDCKKLMQDIKNELTSASTEKQIEDLLKEKLCKQLHFLEDECNDLVKTYIPQVMDMLASQFDPVMVCQLLGFCTGNGSTPVCLIAKLKLTKAPLFQAGQVVRNVAACDTCKVVVAEIQSTLKEKMTQEELEAYLKKELCAKLGMLKEACDQTVDAYGPELFDLIYKELDPSVVCHSLGLCSAGTLFNAIQPVIVQEELPQESTVQQMLAVGDGATCEFCKMVVTTVDKLLAENATEAEIQAALDKVCSLLPSKISAECRDFVDTYGPAIEALLAQELDPDMVCTALGLCEQKHKGVSKLSSGGPVACEVCKLVMHYLDSLLTENTTMEEVEHLLNKICSYLPKGYRNKCHELVEEYGKVIIELLSQFVDPSQMCHEIHLCGREGLSEVPAEKIIPQKAQLVGVNECTYGPAYWCATRQNAEKCKAVAHCKKHVWKN